MEDLVRYLRFVKDFLHCKMVLLSKAAALDPMPECWSSDTGNSFFG